MPETKNIFYATFGENFINVLPNLCYNCIIRTRKVLSFLSDWYVHVHNTIHKIQNIFLYLKKDVLLKEYLGRYQNMR